MSCGTTLETPLAEFFTGVVLDFWRAAVPAEVTDEEVAFAEGALALAPCSRILDAPCGTGRHSLALAERGHRVSGVDLAEPYINQARDEAEARGLADRADFTRADLRALPALGAFDTAICLGNSFGYLDHAGDIATLAALAGALRPAGRLLLETGAAAESLGPHLQPRLWVEAGGILMLVERRHDVRAGRLRMSYRFLQAGNWTTRALSQSVYTAAEIVRMMASVGLEARELIGGLDGRPFERGCSRLYIVAERLASTR